MTSKRKKKSSRRGEKARGEKTRGEKPHRPAHAKGGPRSRNHCLDILRGAAILLMVVDHVAGILFDVSIEPTSIRMVTRLSMPLFCVLMGYFLGSAKQVNWNRYFQLALAAAFMNIVYFTIYREVEILASLLVCYSLFLVLGRGFALLFVASFFYAYDPSIAYFDYPLSVVATCVAQGMILNRYGWRVASATGAMCLLSLFFVSAPTAYVLYLLLPATWLVAWGSQHPQVRLRWLELPGRFPLTAYLAQYCVILAIDQST